uniref:Ribosome biogenesis protein BRX1 homolog n=1 Tax=Clastoptera arizonana TaxID=38151 RepID=A0A1B6E3U0_9HEMI
MTKKKSIKRKREPSSSENKSDELQLPPTTRLSDEPVEKKAKWINKERVLVFASRGISHRDRHLMRDLRTLLPHSRDENKMERRENLLVVNEMCTMKNCNKCILLEGRKKRDLYMWISNVPDGPSGKFLVESVFTMGELKLTGNCLKGSRPLLSFDENFDLHPHYALLKELFIQIFGTPNHHPKSQPFFDRVVSFSILDNRIWFRNYQIISEDGALAEIGPRFVLNPIKIFEGSFGGSTLWDNPLYKTPGSYRRHLNMLASNRYENRQDQKAAYAAKTPKKLYGGKPNDDIFEGEVMEKAIEINEKIKKIKKRQKAKQIKKQKNKYSVSSSVTNQGQDKIAKQKKANKIVNSMLIKT